MCLSNFVFFGVVIFCQEGYVIYNPSIFRMLEGRLQDIAAKQPVFASRALAQKL